MARTKQMAVKNASKKKLAQKSAAKAGIATTPGQTIAELAAGKKPRKPHRYPFSLQ